MKRYLTNTELSNEAICNEAARISGMPIIFEREPMPYTGTFDDEHYHREALIGYYGSVVLVGEDHPEEGCSPFWRVWEKLRDEGFPSHD